MNTDMVKRIARGLAQLGFVRHEAHAWALGEITVRYRSQDDSFLAHFTDGKMHDYSFFDLADDQQAICEAATLMEWVKHYRKVALSSENAAAVKQAA
jgi:hypothetical protein